MFEGVRLCLGFRFPRDGSLGRSPGRNNACREALGELEEQYGTFAFCEKIFSLAQFFSAEAHNRSYQAE